MFIELFLTLIFILLIFVLYFRKRHKGKYGEFIVANQLLKLNKKDYKIINNLLIETASGYSQIDHIVISVYGIFVIETKNYSGWIFGNEKSEFWTQTIYSNKIKFRNPIKQNWSHIYALKYILSDYSNIVYKPVVVFSGSAELKKVYTISPVIYSSDVYKYIMLSSDNKVLSSEQIEEIFIKLKTLNKKDKKIKNRHISEIHYKKNKIYESERSLICPKCGNDLVSRNGKYGEFYGCSNYPRCKYTLKK